MASPDPRPGPRRSPRGRGAVAALAGGAALIGGWLLLGARPAREPDGVIVPLDLHDESGRGSPATPASPQSRKAGHEVGDASASAVTKVLAVFGGTAAVVIVIVVIGVNWLERVNRAELPPLTGQQTATIVPPLPRLQVNPYGDLASVRAHEESILEGWGWADADHSHARIPIGRAMALVAGRPLDPAQ